MLYCIVLCRVVSCRVGSGRVASRRVASNRIASHRIASYRIVSIPNNYLFNLHLPLPFLGPPDFGQSCHVYSWLTHCRWLFVAVV